ncbi:MAG: inosine/xanthosine triphosphatase [bacterium]|nr:inosine/xanthosine triphosphatase [bacterium]
MLTKSIMQNTQKIIVASKNPVKINAALSGFQKMFPDHTFDIEGVSVASGVSNQPQSDAETLQGAHQRVEHARIQYPNADFWVGIEGGIEHKNKEMEAFAWIVVHAKEGGASKGRTGTFFLPPRVAELILEGKELGEADDIVFGTTNSKQANGAIGLLTNNVIHRERYYTEALVLALIPFKNRELYFIA